MISLTIDRVWIQRAGSFGATVAMTGAERSGVDRIWHDDDSLIAAKQLKPKMEHRERAMVFFGVFP